MRRSCRRQQLQPCLERLESRLLLSGVTFPGEPGIVDVTRHGVAANDGLDDSDAINNLMALYHGGNILLYFPDGVYNVSKPLRPGTDDGLVKRTIIQGQSRDGTVFRLADSTFTDAASPQPVWDFQVGTQVAQAFRNALRDVTIDVGFGNAGAIGVEFYASNQGSVRNVKVISQDRSGYCGAKLAFDQNGPLLVSGLEVVGFSVGIHTGFTTASQVFENIILREQTARGWVNENAQTVSIHGLYSYNQVEALWNEGYWLPGDGQGKVTLVDAVLKGYGNASGKSAIVNNKRMYLRNIVTSGYSSALRNDVVSGRGNGALKGPNIDEYLANGAYDTRRGGMLELFESPDGMLRLPIVSTPTIPWNSEWADITAFGAVSGGGDDTAAIQAAIDSGARTIYLPHGTWHIYGTVYVRNNVERIISSEAYVNADANGGTIRVDAGRPSRLVIERMDAGAISIVQNSTRTLVLADLTINSYSNTAAGTGDLFVEDVCGGPWTITNARAWMRQVNPEGTSSPKILNDGGTVWKLGMKTEDAGIRIRTIHGGRTELLGFLHVSGDGTDAMFVTEEASFSVVMPSGGNGSVSETRGGVTLTGSFGLADGYAAFASAAISPRQLYVDNADASGVTTTGTWTAATSYPGGFADQDFLYASAGSNTVRFTPTVAAAGLYSVYVRWINDSGGQVHSNHASNARYDVMYSGGTATIYKDQRTGGGDWVLLGTYQFAAGQGGYVTVSAAGANGTVIADAVRLVAQRPAGDLTGDWLVTAADIDELGSAIAAGWPRTGADLNADGQVNRADVDYLVQTILGTRSGDTNLDRAVAIGDLVTLAQHWGMTGGWADGDFSGDWQITIGDLVALAQNWNFRAAAMAGTAVLDASESRAEALPPVSAVMPTVSAVPSGVLSATATSVAATAAPCGGIYRGGVAVAAPKWVWVALHGPRRAGLLQPLLTLLDG